MHRCLRCMLRQVTDVNENTPGSFLGMDRCVSCLHSRFLLFMQPIPSDFLFRSFSRSSVMSGAARNRQAMQAYIHLRKNARLPLSRVRTFSCLLGRSPIPRSRLRRGCAISAKSLFGQLTAAPTDVLFEHFAPGHPYPKCGRCWPWLSAAPSIPRGPGDSRRMPLSCLQAAQRTQRSTP